TVGAGVVLPTSPGFTRFSPFLAGQRSPFRTSYALAPTPPLYIKNNAYVLFPRHRVPAIVPPADYTAPIGRTAQSVIILESGEDRIIAIFFDKRVKQLLSSSARRLRGD